MAVCSSSASAITRLTRHSRARGARRGTLACRRATSLPTVLLSTCNRVEVYAAYEDRPASVARRVERHSRAPPESTGVSSSHTRSACLAPALRHLVRVAAGLDSLIVGEDQFAVRCATRCAAPKRARLPATLRGVFQTRCGVRRRVRGSTRLSAVPSIAVAGPRRPAHAA